MPGCNPGSRAWQYDALRLDITGMLFIQRGALSREAHGRVISNRQPITMESCEMYG